MTAKKPKSQEGMNEDGDDRLPPEILEVLRDRVTDPVKKPRVFPDMDHPDRHGIRAWYQIR